MFDNAYSRYGERPGSARPNQACTKGLVPAGTKYGSPTVAVSNSRIRSAGSVLSVGFQNSLRFAEQARVLRLIPGLENAQFLRYGQIHRNTYINGPALLTPTLQLRQDPRLFFAGQISGVEGYVESIATGLIAGRHAAAFASGQPLRDFPPATALASLCRYVSGAESKNYQPANITFDLLPKLDEETRHRLRHDKRARQAEVCRRAIVELDQYLAAHAG